MIRRVVSRWATIRWLPVLPMTGCSPFHDSRAWGQRWVSSPVNLTQYSRLNGNTLVTCAVTADPTG